MATNELAKLASAIERQIGTDGADDTAAPALWLARLSAPSALGALVYEPSLCIVAQGAKEKPLAQGDGRVDILTNGKGARLRRASRHAHQGRGRNASQLLL